VISLEEYISVGSRRTRVVVTGAGNPVVFEAGAGEWSAHWSLVTASIGNRFQCIAYDRAGLGLSEPASGSRSAAVLAEELIQVLDELKIGKPAILVAHSFGASVSRLAVNMAPERFCGIVFVDGWHESFDVWERQNISNLASNSSKLINLAERFGIFRTINRLWNLVSPPVCPWPLPAEIWASILAISNSAKFAATTSSEASAYEMGDIEVAAVTNLKVPVVNLVASRTISPEQVPPDYPVDAHNLAWCISSSKLSNLSSNSVTKILDDTDHMVQLACPQEVVKAIVQLERMIQKHRVVGHT